MPPTLRVRKAVAPTSQPQSLLNPSPNVAKRTSGVTYKDDDPFQAAFDNPSDSDIESEASDYAPRSKKARKSTSVRVSKRLTVATMGPPPAPETPDMSDEEPVNDDEATLVSRHTPAVATPSCTSAVSPTIIRLEVPAGTSIINLNVADLLQQHHVLPVRSSPDTQTIAHESRRTSNLFMRLPAELRNCVYRMVLVTDSPIILHQRENFQRSSQLLRASKAITEEGTNVMYGQNSFHFERTAEKRGQFWQQTWQEIGMKDIRRFLETIGMANVAKLKYVSFLLEDAAPYLTPGVTQEERKFVNDPVLQKVFHIIAESASLSRIQVVFSGRAQVQLVDYHFLKSLSTIKAPVVEFPRHIRYHPSKINDAVLDKLLPLMTLSDPEENAVDDKKARRKVKMHFDQPVKANYIKFDW